MFSTKLTRFVISTGASVASEWRNPFLSLSFRLNPPNFCEAKFRRGKEKSLKRGKMEQQNGEEKHNLINLSTSE